MSVVVTGATGKFGRLVVESLLRRGTPAGEIVATGRSIDKLADLAERGVVVRRGDFSEAASLTDAFAGADRLLLVSTDEVGSRTANHANAIAAAQQVGVKLVAYTSILRADTTSLLLAEEHLATEKALLASGLPHVLLRNGWYVENYTAQLPTFVAHGMVGSAGEGRVSLASRADLAEAAAEVLTGDGHTNRTYEFGGEAVTLPQVAAALSAAAGTTITYTDLPVADYEGVLVGAGLPESFAHILADADRGIAAGDLLVEVDDLATLLGRPVTPLADAIAAALR